MSSSFILIAEDDADDRFLIQTAFEEKGFNDRIEFVENGVELLSFLQNIAVTAKEEQNFPGFILLDLNMPKKDGREVLKEIKQHPLYKKIPVIVFTTTRNELEIKRCYELGANTYIVKPISFEALLKVVDDIRSYWFQTASIPA
ncbi:response regulator [Deminuibacter soli]|uniref:Response regulator n=1 Tax=Deminuibacter soli TaxID=2291815 RepID=A0A3E1NL16_9BACT|nr:response regulator [Deminuibacter soli]RFM28625.1 response regulator [Deminuibacter soli]